MHMPVATVLLPGPARRLSRGVTLIEILIVLIILAIFASITLPAMRGMHRKNAVAASARELAVLARLARQMAVMKGRPTEIRMDRTDGRYRLDLNPDADRLRISGGGEQSEVEQVRRIDPERRGIRFETIEIGSETASNAPVATIRFAPDGSATPATVVLADRDGNRMTVETTGASGVVHVSRVLPERRDAAPVPAEENAD